MAVNSVTSLFLYLCGVTLCCFAACVSKILKVEAHVALPLFLLELLCVGTRQQTQEITRRVIQPVTTQLLLHQPLELNLEVSVLLVG